MTAHDDGGRYDDPFADSDAAYVLGALSASDRQRYEQHLRECARCASSVRDLAGMPGLLGRVHTDDVRAVPEPPPATQLPQLLAAVARERRRGRRLTTVLVGSVAACLLALATALVVPALTGDRTAGAAAVAMTAAPSAPIRATAQFSSSAWGTRIRLRCTYDGPYPADTYEFVVKGRDGARQQIATWNGAPTGTITVDATTSFAETDIASLLVQTHAGRPVLRLDR
ncbi:MAG: anti-sigma factor family protein [Mycobacteriales bacterium]|nr:MAG: anti-sigma factor [Pseudonocardiales bacterium]